MGIPYKFDTRKAVEVILYIVAKCPNIYNALKVLYFADKEHLARYGRLICGDNYVAMSHGPVPSGVYDLVKYARGNGFWQTDVPVEQAFKVEGHNIIPLRKPDTDFLSESDIECLDFANEKYGRLSFSRLKEISHKDNAFKSADQNDFIPLEAIIKSLPNGDLLLSYLQDH